MIWIRFREKFIKNLSYQPQICYYYIKIFYPCL